ncbi:MAG: DUF362 domain-containing protein [Anaerolineae bacterium]
MQGEHPRVALVACPDYDLERVEAAVRRAVDLLGGMGAFVQPGQRVLLKPNLLRALPPERAATTHPAVVAAVAKLVIEAGGRPVIADSPGGPYAEAMLRAVYRKSGMVWAAEVSGAELYYGTGSAQVPYPQGKVLHRLDIIQAALDADVLINLAKLKTHNLTTLTLAVKNLFGLVPGSLKISYHAKLQEAGLFTEGLLDIAAYARPALNLIDGIVAMEGNGPSGGDPRQLGALVAGADVVGVDLLATALVGVPPLDVRTTRTAQARGLTSGRLEDLEVLGDPLETLQARDWRMGAAIAVDPGLLPRIARKLLRSGSSAGMGWFGRVAYNAAARQLVVAPRAGPLCVGCGFCAKHCPVEAITVVDSRALMALDRCIRCYCCHELCPYEAVTLRRPWVGRLLLRDRR